MTSTSYQKHPSTECQNKEVHRRVTCHRQCVTGHRTKTHVDTRRTTQAKKTPTHWKAHATHELSKTRPQEHAKTHKRTTPEKKGKHTQTSSPWPSRSPRHPPSTSKHPRTGVKTKASIDSVSDTQRRQSTVCHNPSVVPKVFRLKQSWKAHATHELSRPNIPTKRLNKCRRLAKLDLPLSHILECKPHFVRSHLLPGQSARARVWK